MKYLLISTTTDTPELARKIADTLLEKKLAACVQIVPGVQSRYRWEGKLEVTDEHLCLIKTTAKRYQDVEETIRKLHTYDEPEITAIPFDQGSPGYLGWLQKETT